MVALLKLAQRIDALNERVGHTVYWLILLMTIISALNAMSRKLFNISSNGFLEIQWYLFAAVFLLSAGYTLLKNEHVRIDVITGKFSAKARLWIDIFGTVCFLFPLTLLVLYHSWPYFVSSFISQEFSPNPGGLIIWPARLMIPLGFLLLLLQGLAQLIKLVGALQGKVDISALLKHHTAAEDVVETLISEQKKD